MGMYTDISTPSQLMSLASLWTASNVNRRTGSNRAIPVLKANLETNTVAAKHLDLQESLLGRGERKSCRPFATGECFDAFRKAQLRHLLPMKPVGSKQLRMTLKDLNSLPASPHPSLLGNSIEVSLTSTRCQLTTSSIYIEINFWSGFWCFWRAFFSQKPTLFTTPSVHVTTPSVHTKVVSFQEIGVFVNKNNHPSTANVRNQ